MAGLGIAWVYVERIAQHLFGFCGLAQEGQNLAIKSERLRVELGVGKEIERLLNAVFILAVMSAVQATLTLPGIAGIILTIGMAVDANVIINERIREELRLGKTARAAVEAGYGRAFWTIFDANFTTLIAAVVLWSYGSGPVQGFAVTLFIGIFASMFTAIFVTRLVVDYLVIRLKVQKLSI